MSYRTVVAGNVDGPIGANTIVQGTGSIIYRPGAASADDHVETWPEVQALIASWDGKFVLYVDDSIVSPALVPGGTGVTDFNSRGEIRTWRQDVVNGTTLVVQDGATLKSIYRISGTLFILGDTQGTTPAFDWDYTPSVLGAPLPALFIDETAFFGSTATATQPVVSVLTGKSLVVEVTLGAGIIQGGTSPIFTMAAGAGIELFMTTATLCGPAFAVPAAINWAVGGGSVLIEYDSSSAGFSGGFRASAAAITQLFQYDTANLIGYTPAVPANWVTPPTQVAQALDELAAKPAPPVSVALSQTRVQYWSGVPYEQGGLTWGSNCVLVIGDANLGVYQSATNLLQSCSRGTANTNSAGPTWLGSYDASAGTGSYKTSFVLRGAAPGIGGFTLTTRFGIESVSATPVLQCFVGLIDASGGGGGLPQQGPDFTTQTALQVVGIAFTKNLAVGGLGNWQIVSCNGAAVTASDSGVPIVAGNLVELVLTALPNAATIAWTINDLSAATSTSGVIAATLPVDTLALAWQAGMQVVSGGGVTNTFSTVRYTMDSNY